MGPAGQAAPSRLVVVLHVDPARGQPQTAYGASTRPAEHVFILDRSPVVVGRADGPGLQIPIQGDPFVSRRHAEIIELENAWAVRDLGSTNGTWLNGTPLMGSEVRPIQPHDVIDLGLCSRLTVRQTEP